MREQDKQISEAVASAFGRAPERGHDVLEAFIAAGFTEELAGRGVRMLESGAYLNFVDVANDLRRDGFSLLGADNRPVAPRVSEASIAAAARRLEAAAEASEATGVGVKITEADLQAALDNAFGLGRS